MSDGYYSSKEIREAFDAAGDDLSNHVKIDFSTLKPGKQFDSVQIKFRLSPKHNWTPLRIRTPKETVVGKVCSDHGAGIKLGEITAKLVPDAYMGTKLERERNPDYKIKASDINNTYYVIEKLGLYIEKVLTEMREKGEILSLAEVTAASKKSKSKKGEEAVPDKPTPKLVMKTSDFKFLRPYRKVTVAGEEISNPYIIIKIKYEGEILAKNVSIYDISDDIHPAEREKSLTPTPEELQKILPSGTTVKIKFSADKINITSAGISIGLYLNEVACKREIVKRTKITDNFDSDEDGGGAVATNDNDNNDDIEAPGSDDDLVATDI